MSDIANMSAATRAALMAHLRTPTWRTQLYRTAGQSIPNNVATAVIWQAAEIDELAGVWSAVTNPSRLTVPAGYTKVKLSYQHSWPNVGGGIRATYVTKGAGVSMAGGDYRVAFNEAQGHGHTRWLTVAAGEYLELQVFQNTGAARDLIGGTAEGGAYCPAWILAEWRA